MMAKGQERAGWTHQRGGEEGGGRSRAGEAGQQRGERGPGRDRQGQAGGEITANAREATR